MSRERVTKVLAGGALLLALLLPVGLLTPIPHTGGDNAGYIVLAHSLLERGAYLDLWDIREPIHTKYPPVFPLLLAVPLALGVTSWLGLKAIPLLFSLASLALVHGWTRKRAGPLLAGAVTVLLALSPEFLHGTRWLLSEPPFLTFTLLALWLALAGEDGGEGMGRGRLAAIVGMVILAFFTRSAGLPLVMALLLWLGVIRRWRALPWVAGAVTVPAFLWWLRAQEGGDPDYVAEFWMVDPYRPELGTAGFGELAGRVVGNARAYTLEVLPDGLFAFPQLLWPSVGVTLLLLAAVGWTDRFRQGPGLPELFFPLYAGVLLLWPEVWAGGRFALPLFPLLLYYAGTAITPLLRRAPPRVGGVLGVAIFLGLAGPGAVAWWGEFQGNRGCSAWVREAGPLACHPSAFQEFAVAARWTGEGLPPGVGVLSRNPRHFYLFSGQAGQLFPLTADPEEFLDEADGLGAQVLILDRLTALTDRYAVPVVRARPEAFCHLAEVGDPSGVATQILGILPLHLRDGNGERSEDGVFLERCAPDFLGRDGPGGGRGWRGLPPLHSPLVPLLAPRP